MHFKLRTIVLGLQILLVAGSGGAVAGLAYIMENRQVIADSQKNLASVTQAITRETETTLKQVEVRANMVEVFAHNPLIAMAGGFTFIGILTEILKKHDLVPGIGYIDEATGKSIQIGKKQSGEIYYLETFFDPLKKEFTSLVYEEGDLAKAKPKPGIQNPSDPRKSPFYTAFKEKGPGWIPAHFPEKIPQGNSDPIFSYVLPIRSNQTLRGMIVLDMGITEVGKHLHEIGKQVGFQGHAFALERNYDEKIRVLGYGGKIARAEEGGQIKLAENFPDSEVRAFTHHIQLEEQKGRTDIFAIQKTSFTNIVDETGEKYWCAWTAVFPGKKPDWIIVAMVKEESIFAESRLRMKRFFIALLILLLLSLPLGYFLTRSLTKPMEALSLDAERVGRMEIQNHQIQGYMAFELQRLAQTMQDMKAGLLSFKKFVPEDIVKQVVLSGKTAMPGGKNQTLTLLFTDLVSFTSLGEKLTIQELVSLIGDHLAMCSQIIHHHGGTIDKFIGDSVMAFWNAPEDCPNHAQMAAAAAIDIQKALIEFNLANKEKGLPPLAMRIGLNTGEALVGNIGNSERLNYTALGDTVNLASRLEGANRFYGTSILVSNLTASLVSKEILLRTVDCVSVKGKHEGHLVHELLDFSKNPSPEAVKKAAMTQRAWNYYQMKEWVEAARAYGELRTEFPYDGLAQVMGERCQGYMKEPPGQNWEGIFHLDAK